mgnify:CR=1 FL=1
MTRHYLDPSQSDAHYHRPTTVRGTSIPKDRRAPDGHIWQCRACGKQAEDRYGMTGWHSHGWDESCVLNAVAVPKQGDTP